MAIPEFSLAQFNRIASGEYNAGLVDFATDRNGNLTGELTKVNNHVHQTSKNNVELAPERILEIKEAFINALVRGGVAKDKINEIRQRLGIPAELKMTAQKDERKLMLQKRFKPLTRQFVRSLLDQYANSGRGFTHESQAEVSLYDAEAAQATKTMGRSNVKKRQAVNTAIFRASMNRYGYDMSDAMAILSTSRPLGKLSAALERRITGENVENERNAARTALRNQFTALFDRAIKMLDGAEESETFMLCGFKTKLIKGADGKLSAVLGEGAMQTKIALEFSAVGLVKNLIARAVVDMQTLNSDNLSLMLDKVFTRDTEELLTADDRTSLTRSFAAMVLVKHQLLENARPGAQPLADDAKIAYDEIMQGNYNTGTLVDVANRSLNGEVATKQDLDRLHAELARNNAGLDEEMKAMLTRVAGMPLIAPRNDYGLLNAELQVGGVPRNGIVLDAGRIADEVVPQNPDVPPAPLIGSKGIVEAASEVKNFIADIVFSDDTMVSDVVVTLPGEATRKLFQDDKKLSVLATIFASPEIIDTAVAPPVAAAVKEGFAKFAEIMDDAWRKSHDGETFAAARQKPFATFVTEFKAFLLDPQKMPGKELAKFDAIMQNVANKGCASIQGFINKVFNIDPNAVQNAQGGITTEPYKNMSPEQIKQQLADKSLNQILDDAAKDASSPGQVALFKQVLKDYFVNMARASDKRAAFASALRYANIFNFGSKKGEALESAKKVAIAKFTGAILKGTSPLLQKMMQGLPRTVLGDYADALDDMKSRLAPIPRKIVQAHLQKMIDDSNGKIKSIMLKESLGAASVGEAFLCDFVYADDTGKEKTERLVVKIMRHDAEERVKREAEVITAAAAKIGPGMLKTWKGQLDQYLKEFDFRREGENINTGLELYNVKGNRQHPYYGVAPKVSSIKLSPLVAPSKNALVCTLANGETTDKFFTKKRTYIQESLNPVFERDPETGKLKWTEDGKPIFKKTVTANALHEARTLCGGLYAPIQAAQDKIQQAASLWFSEAILGSGKFHGDAHAGNLMVSDTGGGITFIDFGNVYQLKTHYELGEDGQPIMETVTEPNDDGELVEVQRPKVLMDERVELLRLILGATLRDKAFFLAGFEKLLSPEGKDALAVNRAKAEAILDAILSKGQFSFDVCYRLQGAISELQKLGLEMPPQITCFVQSMTRFQNTMAEMNTILNQTLQVIDALKAGPGYDEKPEPVDPLDLFGQTLALQKSPEGYNIVDVENPEYDPENNPGADEPEFFRLPAYVAKIHEFGSHDEDAISKPDNDYYKALDAAVSQAKDPKAEVKRICKLAIKDYDPVNGALQIKTFTDVANAFARRWDAATNDDERNVAKTSFLRSYTSALQNTFGGQYGAAKAFYMAKYKAPTGFAKVVMGAIFNGADAAQKLMEKNFSKMDKLKIAADATSIATNELNVSKGELAAAGVKKMFGGSGPGPDDIVFSAIVDDIDNTGSDKSYQIDIGI